MLSPRSTRSTRSTCSTCSTCSTFTLALLVSSTLCVATACPDWNAFGDGAGDDDDDDGGEGEGEAGEGEGEAGEGEGEAGEGEGEGATGPLWGVVDVPVPAQAELSFGTKTRLSSSNGRLFAVGTDHIYELVDDGMETIATLEVPCTDVQLTGPVAVDGADILVATIGGALRFHDDGSCEPEYAVSTTGSVGTVAPLAGSALVYDGQSLTLVEEDGTVVDTHAFEDFTEGDFYADGSAAAGESLLLVRRFSSSAGQVVRVSLPGSELIIEPVADAAMMMAGDVPVTVGAASRFGARFLDVTLDSGAVDPVTAELRISDGDSLLAYAADPSGEIAAVGSSSLVALADATDGTLAVTSVTGERIGSLERFVVSPTGELWAVGQKTLLYWTASAAAARSAPVLVDVDQTVASLGPLVAIEGSLFFADENNQLQRADVDTDRFEIVELVDNVSFSPVPVDNVSRFAFVPAGGGAPARIVEAGRSFVRVFELDDDLAAVTATLVTSLSGNFFQTPSSMAILGDGTKAAFLVATSLYVCSIELESGVAPVVTCDGGRSSGAFGSFGDITIVDPSAGVDDETFVVASNSGVGILEPGEQGRSINVATDGNAPALLINGCVVAFSSSERAWSAFNPDQPDAPAGRRGFAASDAVQLGGHVLVLGPDDGRAGQLAHFPAPATSTCRDDAGAPILQGTKLMGGEVRTQSDVVSASFVTGELYVLDEDGLVWHVPTP